MVAAARKPNLAASKAERISREAEDAYFDALSKAAGDRRRHETRDQRVERANKEQYARWLVWQDSLERSLSANLAKQRTVRERRDQLVTLYYAYRTSNPRAQSSGIQDYLCDALKISKGTLDRDLKALRAQGRIPSYHHVPFIPPK